MTWSTFVRGKAALCKSCERVRRTLSPDGMIERGICAPAFSVDHKCEAFPGKDCVYDLVPGDIVRSSIGPLSVKDTADNFRDCREAGSVIVGT
jgi:hypothetical protein